MSAWLEHARHFRPDPDCHLCCPVSAAERFRQEDARDLDRELEKCRQELVSVLERFEDLQRQKEKNQAALRQMRRDWPCRATH